MRTSKDVIDQAIRDNRVPEAILYGFACVFVLSSMTLIGLFVWIRMPLAAVSAVALGGLAWLTVRMTQGLRQQNRMLRMLEVPLMKAGTAEEAAEMLTTAFGNHLQTRPSKEADLVEQVER